MKQNQKNDPKRNEVSFIFIGEKGSGKTTLIAAVEDYMKEGEWGFVYEKKYIPIFPQTKFC